MMPDNDKKTRILFGLMTRFSESLLFVFVILTKIGAHPAFEVDEASIHYRQTFDEGYFPFGDFSTPNPQTERKLAALRQCNLIFADFLRANRSRITLTPPDHPFKVSTLVVVANLYKVSEKDQTVTLTAFIEFSWRDRRLANVGGRRCANVTRVLPNLSGIYFPVFTIENSAERVLYNEAWEKFPVAVYARGVVVWIISLRLVLNCKMNMRTFPYDSQNCYILIRSPHYFQSDLQYYVYNRSMALMLMHENVNRHPLWELNGQMPRLTTSNISGIEIWFRLDRKPSFYLWTLIMPTMLVSLATCLPFLLPSSAEEKMQTCLSGILAYFLLLMTMTEATPQTSEDIPILTLFYVIIIGVGMTSASVCALIVRLAKYERKHHYRNQNNKRTVTVRNSRPHQEKVVLRVHNDINNGSNSTDTLQLNNINHKANRANSVRNHDNNNNKQDEHQEAIEINDEGGHEPAQSQQVQNKWRVIFPQWLKSVNWRRYISSKWLNDSFLVIYVSVLIICYVWLFAYMDSLRADLAEINTRTFNYTTVTTFH